MHWEFLMKCAILMHEGANLNQTHDPGFLLYPILLIDCNLKSKGLGFSPHPKLLFSLLETTQKLLRYY